MKIFEEPNVEVIKYSVEDIVSTSTDPTETTEPDLGGLIGDNCI